MNHFYQDFLRDALSQRCERNSRYSVRAFAKALAIDVAAVSRILSGKQIPSLKICERLFAKLELSPADQQEFLVSVANAHRVAGSKRIPLAFKAMKKPPGRQVDVPTETWKAIASWYHGAIMEMTYLKSFRNDPVWIARHLGVSTLEVERAISRLIDLSLLEEHNGTLRKTAGLVASAQKGISTSAHRKLQREILKRAIDSLENDPIEIRNMTSMVMAINPEKLPAAKKMIQDFSRQLCAFLETGNQTAVYQMGICLYPISKTMGEMS